MLTQALTSHLFQGLHAFHPRLFAYKTARG